MYKWSHIALVIILSLSIVTPSVISFCEDHYEIEISKDLGENDTEKENKKELEEKDSFFESFVTPQLATLTEQQELANSSSSWSSAYAIEIQLPPPKTLG